MMRTCLRLEWYPVWGIWLMPGGREKGAEKNLRYSYQEPAQVPLGEKPKV